ncbi:hypothetical protein [Kitasatospora sp. MBT66]|uniref:hypothetical protein n=1 Tax=Kitasatospora sp. MBT66 TaxID=1444769 RepID=UPI0011EA7179|nr:hypothetical protein [Kitasatospora sp. MBT66]
MATFGTDTSVGSTILVLEEQLPAVEERLRRAQAELDAATTERDAVHQALEALRLLSGGPARTDGDRKTPAADAPPVPPEVARDTEQAASAPAAPVPAEPATEPATVAAGTKKAAPARKAPARKAPEPKKAARTRATARGAKTGGGARTAAKQEPAARTGRTAPRPRPVDATPPTTASAAASAAASTAGRRTVTDADSILAVLSGTAEPMRAREVSEKLGLEPLQANVNAVRTRLERLAKDGRAQRPGRGLYTVTTQAPGA